MSGDDPTLLSLVVARRPVLMLGPLLALGWDWDAAATPPDKDARPPPPRQPNVAVPSRVNFGGPTVSDDRGFLRPHPIPSSLLTANQAYHQARTGIDAETGLPYDSKMAEHLTAYGSKALIFALGKSGYTLSPKIADGLAAGAGLDLKASSTAGKVIEGTVRISLGVGAGVLATAIATSATDLVLGATIVSTAFLGVAAGNVIGVLAVGAVAIAPLAIRIGGPFINDKAVDKAIDVVHKAVDGIGHEVTQVNNSLNQHAGDLQRAIYHLYGL